MTEIQRVTATADTAQLAQQNPNLKPGKINSGCNANVSVIGNKNTVIYVLPSTLACPPCLVTTCSKRITP